MSRPISISPPKGEDIGDMKTELDYDQKMEDVIQSLKGDKVIVLATSSDNRVTARTVSYVNDGLDICFLSWEHHTKCVQIRDNPRVALCKHNMQIEGTAEILGNALDPKNSKYADIFKKRLPQEFQIFSSQDGMVIVKVAPTRVTTMVNLNDWLYLETLDIENGKAYRKELSE
jgi:general stress protein 26